MDTHISGDYISFERTPLNRCLVELSRLLSESAIARGELDRSSGGHAQSAGPSLAVRPTVASMFPLKISILLPHGSGSLWSHTN